MADPNPKWNPKPFQNYPPGELRLISQKGGERTGIKKSDAAKLRRIKDRLRRGAYKDEDQAWLLARLEDRPSMGVEILMTLDQIKKDIDTMHPMAKIQLANAQANAAKFIHGEKVHTENTNINYNVDVNDAVRQAFQRRKQQMNEDEKVI